MNSTDHFESTPTMDVRGRRESIPDPHSTEVQQQARRAQYESMAELWKQRLTAMPTPEQVQESVLIHGLRQVPRSSLTHFGRGKPCEYFVGDDIALTIRVHHDHFDNAGDAFCAELGEPPADDRRMARWRRCGFQVEAGQNDPTMVNGQGDSMIDFGIVRWHEVPATVADAVRKVRGMIVVEPVKNEPHVHDSVYSPEEIVAHCAAVRAEIAERQKHLIDLPV